MRNEISDEKQIFGTYLHGKKKTKMGENGLDWEFEEFVKIHLETFGVILQHNM